MLISKSLEPAAPTAEAEAGQEAAAEDRAQPSEIAEGSAPAAETAAAQTDTVPELHGANPSSPWQIFRKNYWTT